MCSKSKAGAFFHVAYWNAGPHACTKGCVKSKFYTERTGFLCASALAFEQLWDCRWKWWFVRGYVLDVFAFSYCPPDMISIKVQSPWKMRGIVGFQWIMSRFATELRLLCTLYGIGSAQSEKQMSGHHRLNILKQKYMVQKPVFPQLDVQPKFQSLSLHMTLSVK